MTATPLCEVCKHAHFALDPCWQCDRGMCCRRGRLTVEEEAADRLIDETACPLGWRRARHMENGSPASGNPASEVYVHATGARVERWPSGWVYFTVDRAFDWAGSRDEALRLAVPDDDDDDDDPDDDAWMDDAEDDA